MALFKLDWTIDRLFGWEEAKSNKIIDSLVKGITYGDSFKPIEVLQVEKHDYHLILTPGQKKSESGGHHRAYAHFNINKPLLCKKIDIAKPIDTPINIVDIVLVDDNLIKDDIIELNGRKLYVKSYATVKAIHSEYR